MSGEQRNILLITTDQHRCDTMGAYGSRHVRTPNLDGLAERGVVFERAYTQNTVCIPARAWTTGAGRSPEMDSAARATCLQASR